MHLLKTTLLTLALAAALTATAQTDEQITVPASQGTAAQVITLPEGMTSEADSLLSEWMAKKYLYPDTTCTDPDTNPAYTDDEYRERLQRLPVVMEMPYNDVVRSFIDRYTTRLRRTVSYCLGAGNFYMPIFEEALDYYGLPLELKYLPVIESALEPKAKSHAGAVGLWQFMLPTAKRYDLTVNSRIDERSDPYKSTWAAARYLSDLYKIYGDWSLVIAAYNCGPTTVNKAIHRAGGVRDYWTIYPHLPAETRGYVPAFIAANYVMNYYCAHNICPMKTRLPISVDTVTVHRDLHMQQVAELTATDIEAIRALNPQYRTDVIPGTAGPMTLALPADRITAFIDLGDSVYTHRADELLTRRATTPNVDETATSTRRAATASPRKTKADKASSKSSSRKSKKQKQKKSSTRSKTATVKSGDTLDAIAKRNGTTVSKLRKLNGISGSKIMPGDKIRVK